MNTFFSTFTTGFSEVVTRELKIIFPDITIDHLLDGFIVYKTSASIDKIKEVLFLNNSYVLIYQFKNLSNKPFSEMSKKIKQDNQFSKTMRDILGNEKPTLKLIFVEKNQYVGLEKSFVENLSIIINKKTGLIMDRYLGKKELWFLVRSEGIGVVGVRLTQHPDYEKTLQKGELKPEIAQLLCLMSEPEENETFLDPFAGSGAIPLERSKLKPFTKITASDNNKDIQDQLNRRFSDPKVEVNNFDALSLKEIPDSSIDKIVTDPPWGIFNNKLNPETFYPQMLNEFYRVLSSNGILILLLSQKIDLEKGLEQLEQKFQIKQKINTLVNGQKSTVYKLTK